MKPTIGRIVHFQVHGAEAPAAALVVGLNPDGTVNLAVWNENGTPFSAFHVSMGGPDGTVPTPNCWNWPPLAPIQKADPIAEAVNARNEAADRPEWQARLLTEHAELHDKVEKLHAFLSSGKDMDLPEDERDRLCKQRDAMRQYRTILQERINNFTPAPAAAA